MKSLFSYSARLFARYKFLILSISIIFFFNSCKKEIILNEITKSKSLPKIHTIGYQSFINSINIKDLGTLKKISTQSASSEIQASSQGVLAGLTIITDSVKKLEINDTVSYVLSIKLESPNASVFKNLTIQQAKGKTIAFLSTYSPTKSWISKRRETGHNPRFEGTVSYQMVPLFEVQGMQVQVQLTCGWFTKMEIVDHPCNGIPGVSQHWPGESGCSNGTGEGSAWQELVFASAYGCTGGGGGDGSSGSSGGDTGTGGNNGGGNTTPNYPEGYDPCAEGGVKCSVAGADPSPAQQLATLLGITDLTQVNFLDANATVLVNLQTYLTGNNNSEDSKEFARWAVTHLATPGVLSEDVQATRMALAVNNSNFSTTNTEAHYNAISSFLPNTQGMNHQLYAIYFATQCAIIKFEHPEYSLWRVYFEASKEMIHLALDGIGLAPGFGEVADLTNGLIYTVEGDGVNAALSYTAAVPFVGWFSTGAKFAKRTINLASSGKTTLKWIRVAGDAVSFGDRAQLRKVLNLLPGDARQAHHIIPWVKQSHHAIQKAAKKNGTNPFHMNDALNGIPLGNSVHLGSHSHYDNLVQSYLQSIPTNATPDQAYDAIIVLVGKIRTAINNNPGVHINQLIF